MKNLESSSRKVQAGLIGLFILANITGGVVGPIGASVAMAAAPVAQGAVVINEVAWAGTADASNDEWIELYNTTGAAVDLSGWKIKDDGADAFTFPAGATIAAHAYSLIEDREAAVNDITADFIYNMSLANTGDSLQLVDATGAQIDMVDGSGGAWYAGSSTTYATMERKDALAGDIAANFAASTGGSGAHGAAGTAILGTPKAANSVATAGTGGTGSNDQIKAEFAAGNWQVGQTVKLQIKAVNVSDLFAYGYELDYDPAILEYQNANQGTFLSNSGAVGTAFQAGLKGGQAGKLLVAEARTVDPKTGISGSGVLLEVNFQVKTLPPTSTGVIFSSDSFSSSPTGDLSEGYVAATYTPASTVLDPVTNLVAVEGASRYQIKLSWTAPAGSPDNYQIERKNAHGDWVVIGGVTGLEFTDQDGVVGGGQIIPNLTYDYRVSAVKGTVSSITVEKTAQDTRGLKGDNNRSDLVDGRDLERLALHFAENDQSSGFDQLIDTTYDGQVNGSDLIDLGATFAQKY